MKTRISRKGLAAYPPKVAAKIRIIAEQFSLVTFEQKDELPTRVFRTNDSGDIAHFAMAEDGTSIPLAVRIDNKFTVPAGAWMVEVDAYNTMTVYHIIEDAKEQERLKRDQALPLDNVRMRLGCGFK